MFVFLIHWLIEKFKPESYYLQINNMIWQMNSYNFELNQTTFHNKRFHNRLFNSMVLFMFYKWPLRIEVVVTKNQGSRTIAPEENCPPTPKLTLSQTLTLTEGQSSSVAIVWLSPNPKTNPHLDPNPNPNRGAIFLGGQLSVYRHLAGCLSASRLTKVNFWKSSISYIKKLLY